MKEYDYFNPDRIEHERRRLEHQLHRNFVVDVERRLLILIAIGVVAICVTLYAKDESSEYGYVSGTEIITESGKHIPNYERYCSNTVNGKRVTVSYRNGELVGIYTDNTGILVKPQN